MENFIVEGVATASYPFWVQTLLNVVLIGLSSFLIYYLKEKAKNLATQSDISEITDNIERVKSIHNESLESFKYQLQKDFESYKYIDGLCQTLDKELLRRLVKCKLEVSNIISSLSNDDFSPYLALSLIPLGEYLSLYKMRYGNIDEVLAIIGIYDEIIVIDIKIKSMVSDEFPYETFYDQYAFIDIYPNLIRQVDSLLSKFLPKLEL